MHKFQLFLIGNVNQYFRSNGEFKGIPRNLKFSLVCTEDSELIILIHEVEAPTVLHSDGIDFLLLHKNLETVTVRGGGKVDLFTHGNIPTMSFYDESTDFGPALTEEVKAISNYFWEETMNVHIDINDGQFKEKERSLADVREFDAKSKKRQLESGEIQVVVAVS